MFTCLQIQARDQSTSLVMRCGLHIESPAVVCFLYQDSSNKLIFTQIIHDADFALTHPAGDLTQDRYLEDSAPHRGGGGKK